MPQSNGSGLENRHRLLKSIVGSNPTPSANQTKSVSYEKSPDKDGLRIGRKERGDDGSAPSQESAQNVLALFRQHEDRFWGKVQVKHSAECWPWNAARSQFGHGRFKIGGKLYSPHRIAYALSRGPIPPGHGAHGSVIMHICDNPSCCNPSHLRLGTQTENVADMDSKGRAVRRGATRVHAPSEEQIIAILASTKSATSLEKEIGLPRRIICAVRRDNGIDPLAFKRANQFPTPTTR